jgi:hypothetical protein
MHRLASYLFATFTVAPHTPHHHRHRRGSAGRSGLARTPSGPLRGYRSWRSPGYYLPHSQDWPLQPRQVLHCDLRLLSISGGGGFLRWCVSHPRSYSNRKRWHCASVFAAPFLTSPESLGVSHGQPSEIAHSLGCNLRMSGMDRL